VLALLPRQSITGVIHNNGCGAGEVTSTVFSLDLPLSKILIYATDINQPYLNKFQTQINKEQWHVAISNMPSEKLAFEDNKFDLSFANFVIFLTPSNGIPALREAYRTLKPGGTLVHTAWAELPVVEPTKTAHSATRPESSAPLREVPP
jgi:ubiquinone/menaquinone biosynthesis C-methylase UbiE